MGNKNARAAYATELPVQMIYEENPETTAQAVSAGVNSSQWHYVDMAGQTIGPVPAGELLLRFQRHDITEDTYVWNGTDINQWTAIKAIPALWAFVKGEKEKEKEKEKEEEEQDPALKNEKKPEWTFGTQVSSDGQSLRVHVTDTANARRFEGSFSKQQLHEDYGVPVSVDVHEVHRQTENPDVPLLVRWEVHGPERLPSGEVGARLELARFDTTFNNRTFDLTEIREQEHKEGEPGGGTQDKSLEKERFRAMVEAMRKNERDPRWTFGSQVSRDGQSLRVHVTDTGNGRRFAANFSALQLHEDFGVEVPVDLREQQRAMANPQAQQICAWQVHGPEPLPSGEVGVRLEVVRYDMTKNKNKTFDLAEVREHGEGEGERGAEGQPGGAYLALAGEPGYQTQTRSQTQQPSQYIPVQAKSYTRQEPPKQPPKLAPKEEEYQAEAISQDVRQWSVAQVGAYLQVGVHADEEVVARFAKERINGKILLTLTQEDLREYLELPLGIWRPLLQFIQEQRGDDAQPPAPPDEKAAEVAEEEEDDEPVNDKDVRIIRNPVVMLIGVSKFQGLRSECPECNRRDKCDKWHDLPSVHKDIANMRQLLEGDFGYDVFVSDTEMDRDDYQDFVMDTADDVGKKLRTQMKQDTTKGYDGMIVVICGHGDKGDVLIGSDLEPVSLSYITNMLETRITNRNKWFSECPKLYFIDACRGSMNAKENHHGYYVSEADRVRGGAAEDEPEFVHRDENRAIIHASSADYATKDSDEGGVLIQAICAQFAGKTNKQLMKMPLRQAMTRVRQQIKRDVKGTQVSTFQETLLYTHVYLQKKKKEDN